MRLALIFLFSALVLVPAFCFSADAGSIAVDLKNEAEKCRYLQQLCERTQKAQLDWSADVHASEKKIEDLIKEMRRKDLTEQQIKERVEATDDEDVHGKALFNVFLENLTQLNDATEALKAKDSQMPQCYTQCSLSEQK